MPLRNPPVPASLPDMPFLLPCCCIRSTIEGEIVEGLEGATESEVTGVIVLKADAPRASSMLALEREGRRGGTHR